MSRRLLLIGLNHATAPLAVREKLAFGPAERTAALAALRGEFGGIEAALLCTCNRVELYIGREIHAEPKHERMAELLASFRRVDLADLSPHLYAKADREAVAHLFNVAGSLDSMVLGEAQILAQVREAYDESIAAGTAGALLNPLFQRAIAAGRRVRSGTNIADGRLSVASVAVDYARRIFTDFSDKTVLCIGAGKMSRLLIRHLSALKPARLIVVNRDAAKAGALAGMFGGESRPFEQLPELLTTADIVASSTGSPVPIITRAMMEQVMRRRGRRAIFLVDIALPRDVDPEAGSMEGVHLHNLDDLQAVVSATQDRRDDEAKRARAILAEEVQDFLAWQRQRDLGPMIEKLRRRYHDIAQDELERTIGKLPNIAPDERAHLEELSRRIVNKLLHNPMRLLKDVDDGKAPAAHYLRAIERVFGLSDPDHDPDADPTGEP